MCVYVFAYVYARVRARAFACLRVRVHVLARMDVVVRSCGCASVPVRVQGHELTARALCFLLFMSLLDQNAAPCSLCLVQLSTASSVILLSIYVLVNVDVCVPSCVRLCAADLPSSVGVRVYLHVTDP